MSDTHSMSESRLALAAVSAVLKGFEDTLTSERTAHAKTRGALEGLVSVCSNEQRGGEMVRMGSMAGRFAWYEKLAPCLRVARKSLTAAKEALE